MLMSAGNRRVRQEEKDRETAARAQRAGKEPEQDLKAAAEQRQVAARKREDAEDLDELAQRERIERRGASNNSA